MNNFGIGSRKMSLVIVTSPVPGLIDYTEDGIAPPQPDVVSVVSLLDSELMTRFELPFTQVKSVLTSPNGDWFVVMSSTHVEIFSVETGEPIADRYVDHAHTMDLSQDGMTIAVVDYNATVYVLSSVDCTLIQKIKIGGLFNSIKYFGHRLLCSKTPPCVGTSNIVLYKDDTQRRIEVNLLEFAVSHSHTTVAFLTRTEVGLMSGDLDGFTVSCPLKGDEIAFSSDDSFIFVSCQMCVHVLTLDLVVIKEVIMGYNVGKVFPYGDRFICGHMGTFSIVDWTTLDIDEYPISGYFENAVVIVGNVLM
jgi:WD40 repeat protein